MLKWKRYKLNIQLSDWMLEIKVIIVKVFGLLYNLFVKMEMNDRTALRLIIWHISPDEISYPIYYGKPKSAFKLLDNNYDYQKVIRIYQKLMKL